MAKSAESDNDARVRATASNIQPQNGEAKYSISSFPKQFSKDKLNQASNNGTSERPETVSQLEKVIKSAALTCNKAKNNYENGEKLDEISMQTKLAEIEKAQMEEYHLLKRSGWSDFLLYYGQGENKGKVLKQI